MSFPIDDARAQFPALKRKVNGQSVCYFDGPAGSQVPESVAEAVGQYLLTTNSNRGAPFAVSQESDVLLEQGHQTLADFLGTSDPGTIVFGQNMTSLTFALSRALARTWRSGDEIIVTRLDHDANVTPWILAAEEQGVVVHHVPVNLEDCTLDQDAFQSFLSERTRLVAVGYASNATGTINPIEQMIEAAHQVGALTFIDAVHLAPHRRLNVTQLDCDFLCCSSYKFFGPHLGVMYGKRELLETLPVDKLRPSPTSLPGRWMTGTQSHEAICGAAAAVDYLSELGRVEEEDDSDRTGRLDRVMASIAEYEAALGSYFLSRFKEFSNLKLWGISDALRMTERVPTFSLTHPTMSPQSLAERLAESGIFVWPGNHYALPFTETAGLEPHGTLRVGLLHYNTREEIDRLVDSLVQLLQQ